ncbi:MAG: FTR1 family protein [Anaerolineae bacterium]|nr:FTR1 family protein [Anaerolineae bacterium]
MKFRHITIFILCCFALLFGAGITIGQEQSPRTLAENVRQALFDAQGMLLSGDTGSAAQATAAARADFESLRPIIAQVDPTLTGQIANYLDGAETAASEGDTLALAGLRGRIWSALLHGSALVVFDALESGDVETAQRWLTLRDYRPSTRFSRPGANATLAVSGLIAGEVTREDALAAVTADLYDSYQTQLNMALNDADQAAARQFTMRRAEETGLAAGYFTLLAGTYGEQYGDDKQAEASAAFEALEYAAIRGDEAAYSAARAGIDAILTGFRAAPLSDEEAARRAGQLLRFISLVPIEYERGVRNGEVINDIEIQEALTFREGAVAAFIDLQSALLEINPEITIRVGEALSLAETQIRDVAEPAELQTNISAIQSDLAALLPSEWQEANAASDVDVIYSVLDTLEGAARQGEYTLAESSRLEAYALLEMGMEQRLRGFAPELAARVESLFWQGYEGQDGLATLLGTRAPVDEVLAGIGALRAALADSQEALGVGSAPAAIIGNAAIIVFREGLEAVLILASLLASLRTTEERQFRRPIIMGAVFALGATLITWVIAHSLLQIMLPLGEKLEVVVSLIAIGVLLLITNWFFHKVYWTGWMANFHQRKKRLIGGIAVITISQSLGLITLGFTSIYREGFETVLFLQSLVLDAGLWTVIQGVLLGGIGVVIVGFITFSLQVRLPYKKMLIVTGVMIGVVLVTMVGHTTQAMQAVGWMPVTPIPGLQIPYWMGQWFGFYPTIQGLGLQVFAAVFVIGSYFLAEYQQKIKRQHTRKSAPAAVQKA